MSYKTTLLNEYKQIKADLKQEIIKLARINKVILSDKNIDEFDLKRVNENLNLISDKEKQISYCNSQLKEVLKINIERRQS